MRPPVDQAFLHRRRPLLQTLLPLAASFSSTFTTSPAPASALTDSAPVGDAMFSRLRARYILLRPGETTFEAAGLVDSNPLNKGIKERGLTDKGREQVLQSAQALKAAGVDPTVFFDNGARAIQSADILSRELQIPRNRMEPEFRWLEARGLGALDGTDLRKASLQMRALDAVEMPPQPRALLNFSNGSVAVAVAPFPSRR